MTDKQRKQTGKFLLIAQIPVYLFSIFIFSQLSGSEKTNSNQLTEQKEYPNGKINMDIPEAKIDQPIDKLSLIKKAYNDSVELAKINNKGERILEGLSQANQNPTGVSRLQDKLDQITTELEKEEKASMNNTSRRYGNAYSYQDFEREQKRKNDLAKLDKITNDLASTGDNQEIQELNDVNATMDKLVEVMKMANAYENGMPLSENPKSLEEGVQIYQAGKPKGEFLDINTAGFNEIAKNDNIYTDNTFKGSFFNQQTLTSGETVKIKLDEPMLINDVIIEANNFIYGKVSISGDRLAINITSIRYKDYLFPVSLQVYDYDGQRGIHIPGSITRDKGKQQASSSIRGMNFDVNSLDQTVETKAISTGSNLIKDVFATKVRQVKVTVKPYHKILIKNN